MMNHDTCCCQEYLLSRLDTQCRVVVRAETGLLYSVPIAYPLQFKVHGSSSSSKSSRELIGDSVKHTVIDANYITFVSNTVR